MAVDVESFVEVCLVFAGLEVKCEGTSEVDFLMPSV